MARRQRVHVASLSETRPSFAMRDRDREAAPVHPVEEDTRRHASFSRGLGDLHHAEARLILLTDIPLETGPVATPRHDRFELAEELAAIAHAQREGVLPLEERLEFRSRVWMQQDRLRPSLPGAQDVAVAETATGSHADESGERDAAGEDVGHVDINRGKAGGVERERHFCVAVRPLVAENGDAGLGRDERGEGKEGGLVAEDRLLGPEREVVGKAGVDLGEDGFVFGVGTQRVVADALELVGSIGPGLLERGTRRAEYELRAVVDGDVLSGRFRADSSDFVEEAWWRAACREARLEGVFVLPADLKHRAELFVE